METLSLLFFGLLGLVLLFVSAFFAFFVIIGLALFISYLRTKGITAREKLALCSILAGLTAWAVWLSYYSGHIGLSYLTP